MQVENLAAYRYEMMEDIKKRRLREYRQQRNSNQTCYSVSRPYTKEYRRILRAFYKKRLEDLVRKRIRP